MACGQRLACALAGAFRLGQGQRGARGFQRAQRLLAAALLFNPERAHEVGDAFAEPGARRLHPGVGERVGQNAVQLLRRGLADRGGQQGAGLEGRVLRVGQVQEGKLGAGALAQPALQKGRDRGGGRRSRPGTAVSSSGSVQRVVLAAACGVRVATNRLGASKPRVVAARGGRGHAENFGPVAGVGDGQRRGVAVDERHGGRLAVRKFDRQPQAEMRAGQAQLVLAHLVEKPRSVAKDHGNARNRIPDHVAEAAQAGECHADAVPIRVQGHVVGGSNGQQALGRGGDGAGVSDVELADLARARAARRAELRPRAIGRCGRHRS